MYKDKFIWDDSKYIENIDKHRITFEEASTVFEDENAIYEFDGAHSETEERFTVLGYSEQARMVVVCHCFRNGDSLVRIISARRATKSEQKLYYGGT